MFSNFFQSLPSGLLRTWILVGLCVLLGLVGIIGIGQHVLGQGAMPSPSPAVLGTQRKNSKPAVVQPTQTHVQPTQTTAQPTPATAASQQQSPLADDTFARQNQPMWGISSDGNLWEGDANQPDLKDAFSITDHQGRITGLGSQGQTTIFNALLGMQAGNVDVVAAGVVQQFNGQDNLGVLARWTDGDHWYKALIDGTHLTILLRNGGPNMAIASMPFTTQGNTSYTLRFRAAGATLSARVWQTGTPEPQNWMITVTDTTFTTGHVGLRVVLHDTNMIAITSFVAHTVNSPA